MNRLTKANSGRGKAVPKTQSPSIRAAGTCAPVDGAAATHVQAGGTGVPQAVAVPSTYAPQTGASPIGGWWPTASPSEGIYPPGGFTNYLQSNGNNIPENFHFVGAATNQSSISPIDLADRRTPSPTLNDAVNDVDAQETINVDEDHRTDRRLNWSVDEDKRLASAWLRNSKDPVDGNCRKAEQYWADVTEEYNNTTENSRKRNRNQLKIRWDRVKKPSIDFHGCWVNTGRVWASGMSDDQLTDKALEVYAGQNNSKPFTLMHMWKVVRGDQKWLAYLNRLKKEMEKGAKANLTQLINLKLDGEKRPIGHKKAKKELNGKRKATDALSDINGNFEKYIEASSKNREDREKMAKIQQSLANKKIEAAKLNHEAAHEQTKCKMLETYTQLLLAPTEHLTAEALAEKNLALQSLRVALFPKN